MLENAIVFCVVCAFVARGCADSIPASRQQNGSKKCFMILLEGMMD
jgi:hypothetical protein